MPNSDAQYSYGTLIICISHQSEDGAHFILLGKRARTDDELNIWSSKILIQKVKHAIPSSHLPHTSSN
jgi:hypothetical protein